MATAHLFIETYSNVLCLNYLPRCTVLYGTPTMFIDIITVATKIMETDRRIFEKLSSLELALTAGAICTPELFGKMKNILSFKHIFVSRWFIWVYEILFLNKPRVSLLKPSCFSQLTAWQKLVQLPFSPDQRIPKSRSLLLLATYSIIRR